MTDEAQRSAEEPPAGEQETSAPPLSDHIPEGAAFAQPEMKIDPRMNRVVLTIHYYDRDGNKLPNGPGPPPQPEPLLVAEGWWAPNVKSGQVHEHPERVGRGWSPTMHRECELVYTKRPAEPPPR